jgi:hypothetical protein
MSTVRALDGLSIDSAWRIPFTVSELTDSIHRRYRAQYAPRMFPPTAAAGFYCP